MLQNVRVTAFSVSELLRENQQPTWGGWGGGKITPPPLTQIRVYIRRQTKKWLAVANLKHNSSFL